jgi:two-component system, NtrC family, response regulator AtoC
LLGESGTGKEVAARAIHGSSDHRNGPFVAVNCAALSEQLLESELFGHEKGAFTGAASLRRGRIELAQGGTLFLDEVGELKPELQVKLLRVLQERAFERVGGTRTLHASVRWVAATNRDLQSMVTDGRFRLDLYHRLAVFPIRMPALRARREDILPLADELLRQVGLETGRRGLSLDPTVKDMLVNAHWPGNIRELRNVLERASILSDGSMIRPEHLWLDQDPPGARPNGTSAFPPISPMAFSSLEEAEKTAIEHALHAVGGNRRKAAERLGIGLRTLYDKLKRHGL